MRLCRSRRFVSRDPKAPSLARSKRLQFRLIHARGEVRPPGVQNRGNVGTEHGDVDVLVLREQVAADLSFGDRPCVWVAFLAAAVAISARELSLVDKLVLHVNE